jgi:spore coat polysaccharide biosynthesis protein SpsF
MKKLVGVVQARMGSSRLPGKVMRPLAGRSVLAWVVRAVRSSEALDDLVVATTIESADDAIVAECAALGVDVYRGSVDDVLGRCLGAIADRDALAVARFTADCPLLDPALIAAAAAAWRAAPWVDYVSTALPRSVPRGMDVEIVRADALHAVAEVETGYHRTHVTSGVYTNPDRYRLLGLNFQPSAADLRVTVDTPEDWATIEAIVEALGDRSPGIGDLVGFLRNRPDIAGLNAAVRQKPLEAG